MNSLKFTKEHIKWTLGEKRLSSLFVCLSEERYGYDEVDGKWVWNGERYGSKMFSLYCNWIEPVWGKNVNGDPVLRDEYRTHHLLNLSTDFQKANEKAIKLCKELKVLKGLYLTDKPIHQNPYTYRTKEELARAKAWESIRTEVLSLRRIKDKVKKHSFKITELRDKRLFPSNYVGEVKQRSEFTLKVQFSINFANDWGGTTMTNLKDKDGNVFVYWGSAFVGSKGDEVKLIATIKEHKLYRGVKQTLINRPQTLERNNEKVDRFGNVLRSA